MGQGDTGVVAGRGTLTVSDGPSLSALAFGPYPDRAPRGVEDQLRVEAAPRLGDPERGPLADDLQRPAGRQWPRPPPREMRARTAAAQERPQDRPRRLGVVVWPPAAVAADDLPAIRQLHPPPTPPPAPPPIPGPPPPPLPPTRLP